MYSLFDIDISSHPTCYTIPMFNNVKKILSNQIQKSVDYYRDAVSPIKGDHFLVQLLSNLNVSFSRDLYDYVTTARDRTESIARNFKLIHPTNAVVQPRDGSFYNKNVSEYIIASEEPFDIEAADKSWGLVIPDKIHCHPFTDMSIGIPNGNYSNTFENGYAVLSVNVALLALQWRGYCRAFKKHRLDKSAMKQFVYNYVMANMIARHTELCLINRTMAYTTLSSVTPFIRMHPFQVFDTTHEIDAVILKRTEYTRKNSLKFNEVFTIHETIRYKNWARAIRLPSIALTRNTKWVYVLAYLPYLDYYTAILKARTTRIDSELAQTIKRHLSYLENTRGLPVPLDFHSGKLYLKVKDQLALLKG